MFPDGNPGQRVLSLGYGVIGSLALQFVRSKGGLVTACDIVPERLQLARDLEAATVFDAAAPGVEASAQYGLVIEASGAPPPSKRRFSSRPQADASRSSAYRAKPPRVSHAIVQKGLII